MFPIVGPLCTPCECSCIHFHRKLMQSFFLVEGRGLISSCSYSFWRRSNYFLAVERLQFLTRAELLLLYMQFCVRGLSRPRYVIKEETFNHCGRSNMYMNTAMYIYTYIYMYIYMCVLWCRVMSCVARRCSLVGWVGVVW